MPETDVEDRGGIESSGNSVDANSNNTSPSSLLCLAEGCGRCFSDRRGWVAHMAAKHSIHPPGSHKAIAGQRWVGAPLSPFDGSNQSQEGGRCPECFPMFVLTVDNSHYRERMRDTRIHLESCGFTANEIIGIHMLDLADHPELKPRSVIMEGWKRVLLPFLQSWLATSRQCKCNSPPGYMLVAEDDIRFPIGESEASSSIRDWVHSEAKLVHTAVPSAAIVSLGHAWASSTRKPLLRHLKDGGGVHAATLLSLSTEHLGLLADHLGARSIRSTHIDQHIFLLQTELPIALHPRPLCAWCPDPNGLNGARAGAEPPRGSTGDGGLDDCLIAACANLKLSCNNATMTRSIQKQPP